MSLLAPVSQTVVCTELMEQGDNDRGEGVGPPHLWRVPHCRASGFSSERSVGKSLLSLNWAELMGRNNANKPNATRSTGLSDGNTETLPLPDTPFHTLTPSLSSSLSVSLYISIALSLALSLSFLLFLSPCISCSLSCPLSFFLSLHLSLFLYPSFHILVFPLFPDIKSLSE